MNKILWCGGLLGFTVFAHTAHLAAYFTGHGSVPPSLWLPQLAGWLMICTTSFYLYENIPLISRRFINEIVQDPLVLITVAFIALQHAMPLVEWDIAESVVSGLVLAYYYIYFQRISR